MPNKKLLGCLLIFWVLAYGLSFAFHQIPDLKPEKINVGLILCGAGPLLSGLICYRVFNIPNYNKISLGGVRPFITYAIVAVAILLPFIIISDKQTLLIIVLTQFAYTFGEEFGWRHFLQNLVSPVNKWIQPVIIGTLWFFWHYSFIDNPVKAITGQDLPFYTGIPLMLALFSALSFIWGDLTLKTRSVLIPTVYHYIGKVGEPVTFGIIIISLIILHIFWDKLFPKSAPLKKKALSEGNCIILFCLVNQVTGQRQKDKRRKIRN